MRTARCFILFCVVAAAVPTALFGRTAGEDIPEIKANDNRLPCGRLKDGVFTIELEARVGVWYPEEGDGPALHVQAFAEAGHSPEIPGPFVSSADPLADPLVFRFLFTSNERSEFSYSYAGRVQCVLTGPNFVFCFGAICHSSRGVAMYARNVPDTTK
jgi:hypothetical protein